MKAIFLASLIFMMFQGSANATSDISLPYFITDKEAPEGVVLQPSQYSMLPHQLTVETIIKQNGTTVLTSTVFQVTLHDRDTCVAAMRRVVKADNAFGDIVAGSISTNTKRRAYCSTAGFQTPAGY